MKKNMEWKNAVDCGENLLEINPKNVSVKIHLADCHFNLREYEKSLSYLNELHGKKFTYKTGLVLFKLKRYEEAIEKLKYLKSMKAYLLIGKSYEKMGKPINAMMFLMNTYKKNPDIELLFEACEISIKNSMHEHAISILERILVRDSKNKKALEKIAECYLELQKFEYVLDYCEKLLEVNENHADAYWMLSETYIYLGDFENAIKYVEMGLDRNPKSSKQWIQKGWTVYPDDFEGFKRAYEKGLKLEPNNIKNFIGFINTCLWHDKDIARKYYEKLKFYNPTFSISFEEMSEERGFYGYI